ncbi:MAG: TetR/AcrR family transcriptional regulator [Myxococcota bacterium]
MTTLARFDKLPDDKKRRILEVAAQEFIEHGFEKASLNLIIERAGISKGSMYYYFHDKTHLYVAVLDRMVMRVFEQQPLPERSTLTADNYWQRFSEYMIQLANYWEEHPEVTALAKTMTPMRHLRGEAPFKSLYERTRIWLDRIFDAGQSLGVIRDDMPRDLMMTLWLAVDDVLDAHALERWDSMSPQEHSDYIVNGWNMFQRMFEAS